MQGVMKRPESEYANAIGQRLKLEMKKRGVAPSELAKQAGVKTSFLYDIFNGKSTNPSTVKLARVAHQLGINLSYLVGSADSPELPKQSPDEAYAVVPQIMVDVAAGSGTVISMTGQGNDPFLYRKVWIEEYLRVRLEDVRAMTRRGDSMEPTLHHNDTILIDTSQKTPSPAGLFVLFDGFSLVVKRVEQLGQQQPARLRITADNSQYASYDRSADETFIIGRVIWCARGI